MTDWLDRLSQTLRAGDAAMLVIVAGVDGSGPREAGARMIVTRTGLDGTIGGGQLEFEALSSARAELEGAPDVFLKRFPLGPALGQCCGGVVTLMFEPFTPADAAWVDKLVRHDGGPFDMMRMVRRHGDGTVDRTLLSGDDAAGHDDPWIRESARVLAGDGDDGFRARLDGDEFVVLERLRDACRPVWLFGAGHVGRALAPALAPLPFRLTWIDSRAEEFPVSLPPNVTPLSPAMPHLMVDEAPPATWFLVMTHSHGLDQDICEAVLRRRDFAYLGLIGSRTKAARFASRLTAMGIATTDLARLHCPIGLPGITGKSPGTIAASVAADLLMRLEQTVPAERATGFIEGSLDA